MGDGPGGARPGSFSLENQIREFSPMVERIAVLALAPEDRAAIKLSVR